MKERSMTEEPKPDQEEIPNPRKRRRPPVIDGEAKEIPPPGSTANTRSFTERMRDRWAAAEWNLPALFGVAGALAGIGAGLLGAWLFAQPAPQPEDLSGLRNEIARLTARVTAQENAPKPAPAPAPDLGPLNERSGKLETTIEQLRNEIAELKRLAETRPAQEPTADVEGIARRLAGIEQRIDTAAAAPKAAPQQPSPRAAQVVALGALRDAIARGGGYARELETVRALLKDRDAELAPLAAHAETGLPTVAELAKRFAPVASSLVRTPQPESGIIDRLWNNAGKMIEVRPVGEPAGSDPGAVVARMEAKLARGDLAGALEDARALPPAVRATAKDWFETAEQRRDAEVLIRNLTNAALAAIAAETPKP